MNRTLLRVVQVVVAGLAGAAQAQAVVFSFDQAIYEAKGPLKAPEGLACNDRGYLVVGDTGNKRLVLFSVKEGRVFPGDEVKLPQLVSPTRLQIDSKGNVLALDGKTRKIVKVSANGGFDGTLEPTGLPKDSPLVIGAFKLDAKDTAYLLDVAGRRVLVVDSGGALATQIPLPKDAVSITDIAPDAAGNLYAVDAVTGTLWVAEKGTGSFRSLASKLKDKMSFPTAITVSRGRLFVVDRHGNGVVIFGIDGSYMGRQLAVGWTNGLINYPGQLCLTDSGAVFLADTLNNRVQVFSTGNK